MHKIIVVIGVILFLGITLCSAQEESITITTYYPSPYGVYNQMVTNTLGVGDNDGDTDLDSDDAPDPSINPGEVWIAGNVGIGTTNPGRILECKNGGGNPRADGWDIWSSREFKKDITYLYEEDYTQILAKLENIKVARYHFKSEPKEAKLRLGLIAEEAPAEIVSSDKKSTSLSDAIGFLMAVVKAQQREIQALKQKLITQ